MTVKTSKNLFLFLSKKVQVSDIFVLYNTYARL